MCQIESIRTVYQRTDERSERSMSGDRQVLICILRICESSLTLKASFDNWHNLSMIGNNKNTLYY